MLPYLPLELEDMYLAQLYAYFDESGTESDPVVVFSGFIDRFENWRNFQNEWSQWLRHYHVPEFHTRSALRYSQAYGNMQPGDADKRTQDVLPGNVR